MLSIPSRGLRSRTAASAALIVLVVVLLFRRAVLEGQVLFERDLHLMWYTQVDTMVRAVAAGGWPLWNPSLGFGQPLWADANTQVLYPTTWLHLVFLPWTYYTLFVVAHFTLAGLGLLVFTRQLGLSRRSGLLAAVTWVLSGPLVSLAPMWNQLSGAAWIPWGAAAAERAFATGRLRPTVLWGATLALQVLAGAPEMALMGLLVVAVLAARATLVEGAAAIRRVLRSSAVALAFAALLSAGQWLPSVAVAQASLRSNLPEAVRSYWSIHPVTLLQLLFPAPLRDWPLRPDLRRLWLDGREPFLASLFIGSTTATLSLLAAYGRRRRLAVAFHGLAVVSILIAVGRYTPLFGWVTGIPLLHSLRYPAKAAVLASFCWALLAGLGFESLRRLQIPRRAVATAAAALLGIALLAGLAAALARVEAPTVGPCLLDDLGSTLSFAELLAPTSRALAVAALLGGVGALSLAGLLARPRWAACSGAVLAAVPLVDLFLAHQGLNPTAPASLFTHRPPAVEVLAPVAESRLYAYDYFVPGTSEALLHRPVPYLLSRAPVGWSPKAAQALGMRMVLFPPSAGVWGISGSFDQDVSGLQPRFLAQLTEALRAVEGTPAQLRLLRIGGVQRVAALHTRGFEELESLGEWPSLYPEPLHLFRVPDPLPRSFAVASARVGDGARALGVLLDPGFDPKREVLLATGSPVSGAANFQGITRIVRREADLVEIDAALTHPGYVVLIDAFDDAWKGWLDGSSVPVLRANLAFRAVAVPAGHHLIRLAYRPRSVTVGLLLSAAGAALGLAAMLAGRRSGAVAP